MRRYKVHALGLCVTLAMLMAGNLLGATYYVSPSGDDSNAGTLASSALRTIKRAASVARNGDRVLVSAGEYMESFNIIGKQGASQLQFVASEPGSVIVGGQINVVDSNGIVFADFKFAGNADRFLTWQGSYEGTLSGCEFLRGRNALLIKSGSLTIDGCQLSDFASDGIEVDGAAKLSVSRSQISGCQGSAIKVLKDARVAIDDSNISDNLGDGLRVAVTTDSIPVTSGSCDCTGTTPQSMKRDAYDLLGGVNPQTGAYQQAIQDARNAILSSLNSSLWQDQWTATAAGGQTVYERSQTAIELLEAVYNDDIDFFISGDDVIVNQPFKLSLKVLGAEISTSSYDVPVTTSAKAGNDNYEPWGSFNSPTQGNVNDNSNPRDFTDSKTHPPGTSVSVSGRSWVKRSNSYSGNSDSHWRTYLTVSSSNQSGNLIVLRDGDAVPNLSGYGGQASAASFLTSYIENGRIKLAKNQAIFLFELGTTNLSSAAADFQDLVVLLTMKRTDSKVTPEEADLILQAINLLLESDKNLASCAINHAFCAGGDADAIAEAESFFNKALRETAAGHFVQATKDYRTAWEASQKALANASGSGTVSSTSPRPPASWTAIDMPIISVSSSTMTGNNSAVAMFTKGSFDGRNSDFSQNKQWGTRLRGEVTLNDCTINANGVTGVWLEDGNTATVYVSQLELQDNVTYGLFLENCVMSFDAATLDKWSISGSEIVLAGEGSDLSLSNLEIRGGSTAAVNVVDCNMRATNSAFSDCGYGISATDSNVSLYDCTLSGNTVGLQADQNKSLLVQDSKLDGNTQWGVKLSGRGSFINATISGNGTGGLEVTGTLSSNLSLTGTTVSDNQQYGLYCSGSTLNFNPTTFDESTVTGSETLFAGFESTLTFEGLTISGGSQFGVANYSGQVTVNECTLSGNGIGLYSDAACAGTGSTFTNNTTTGASVVGSATFTNCVFENNPNGLQITNDTIGQVTLVGSQIRNNTLYGVWCDACTFTFNATMQDGWNVQHNGSNFGSTGSTLTFDGFTISNGTTYGIVTERGTLHLNNSTLSANGTGVYIDAHSALLASGSRFTGSTSYGVHLVGSGSLHNCSISGNANGLYANTSNMTDANLTGTAISGNSAYGVYVNSASLALTAQSTEGWSIDSNGYNIAGHQAHISLVGARLTDATHTGVLAQHGSVNIQQSTITSHSGGAWAFNTSGFTLDRSLISGSPTGSWGVASVDGGLTMRNSVVSGAQFGVYSSDSANPATIYNTTIADSSQYGLYLFNGDVTVMNTIISGSNGTSGLYRGISANVTHSHNLISGFAVPLENATPDETELFDPPRFVNAAQGDFRLAKGSPAINAGADLSASHTVDMAGNSRPSRKVFEIGAYEYVQEGGSLRILDWQEKR